MGLQGAQDGASLKPFAIDQVVTQKRGNWCDVDPLTEDESADEVVVTTDRGLVRLVVAATEVGARFAREGIAHDPAAWMLAPRAIFDGRPAVDACRELKHFSRNILVHGLSLGLDASPSELDELLKDDKKSESRNERAGGSSERGFADDDRGRLRRRELLTCWIDAERDGIRLFAFCAMVTDDPALLVKRVAGRYGWASVDAANFAIGFDPSTPLACAMISDCMADTLKLAADRPDSPLAAGLDLVVEQRFSS